MIKTLLIKALAVITCFLILTGAGVLGFNLFGSAMLTNANWQAGMDPPLNYVWSTIAMALAGSLLGGLALAWIAKTSLYRTAAFAIVLAVIPRAMQYVHAEDPHWYTAALIFLPIIGILLGVYLYRSMQGKDQPN